MLDWRTLGDETVGLLQRYLAIDTTNPPGNESAGAHFLARGAGGRRHRQRDRRVGARSRQPRRAPGGRRLARHRPAPPHRRRVRRPSVLDGGPVRRRHRRRVPLRTRQSRHEIDRHPPARGGAGAQARARPAQARSHFPRHRRRGGGQRVRRPLRRRAASGLAGRGGVRSVGAGRHRARAQLSCTPGHHHHLGKTRAAAQSDGARRARSRLAAVARHRTASSAP
jgi:hypothetical protein